MTPIELRQKGYQALLSALEPIEAIRFLPKNELKPRPFMAGDVSN